MLSKVLCSLLILQCVSADGHNSVEEIIDRIGDYASSLGLNTDRDEWFWDSRYWYPPAHHMMKCPRGMAWEGDFEDGTCEMCPAGHFSDEYSFGMQSRCIPCSPTEFEGGEGRGYCQGDCSYGTTFKTGSTSESECVNDPDEMFEGSFQSEVSVKVHMSGDWTFLNDILMEASGMNFYEARAHVTHNEVYNMRDGMSELHVRAVLPNSVAVRAHGFLLEAKTYAHSINDYAALGDHYTKIIFDMLNNAETFKEFGWKMNHEQLRVKDARIMNADVRLDQHCEDGYRSEEWEGVGTKCVKDEGTDAPSYRRSAFLQYTGDSEDCMSLGGEARLRDFVHNEWPFPCREERECEAHFTTCRSIDNNKCAILIHLIFYDEGAGIGTMNTNIDSARDVEYVDGTSFEYSEENSYKFRGEDCGADPEIGSDGSFFCSEGCNSGDGFRLTRSGHCRQCPYGTWLDEDDSSVFPRCHSCGYYHWTVYGMVPKNADECLQSPSFKARNSDGVWTGYPRSMAADLDFELNAEVEMNLCEVVGVKRRFDDFCSDKFSMERMSLNDFSDYNVEMLGCMVMQEFSEIYEHSCRDFDRSWSDMMDDFEWGDVACFVAKHIHMIEERGVDCEFLSEDEQRMTMPFEFSEEAGEAEWASALWLPLFSHAKKMERFSMDSVSKTMEGVFRKFGMYEMSKLTGLEMMDHVRDMIMAVPRGLRVTRGEFEFMTSKDDMYCDNGNMRVNCYYEDACYSAKCNHEEYSEDELQCREDPCNNCQVVFTYDQEPVECRVEEKPECEAPNQVENGKLFSMQTHPRGSYDVDEDELCDGCERPHVTYQYMCNEGFRLVNVGDASSYDERRCDERRFYCQTTDGEINERPECRRDTCEYRDIENGYISKIHAESDSPCRSAEYRCDDGYDMVGERWVHCHPDGEYTKYPTCEKSECQFDDEENARFITEYTTYNGDREAWYQCTNGARYYEDVYDEVECGEEGTSCRLRDECPPMIMNGYLMREWYWEEREMYVGEYRCNDGWELRNPQVFASSKQEYEDKYGWGICDGDRTDPEMLPRCVKPGSPEPCNMPRDIMNGYRVEEIMSEEYGMVNMAKYRCNSGFMMVETWKGDIGWCRDDGTFELPYCQSPRDYLNVEFELEPGMSKMENAGRVKARWVYADESTGEWYAGCDDHFNGPAAGAICRSMGFRHGKQIMGDRKMKPIENLPFGMTNIYCYHDDTLMMSPSCNADEYGQMGWPLCSPEEQIAVKCFDDMWKVDVGFNMVARNGKMSCPVKVMKEGMEMKMKGMDVHVKWGGVHLMGEDDYETEYFEEGVHYETMGKFSRKKGFRAKFIGNMMDYDCFFCDIYMGEHIMNPWPDRNHNCPEEYHNKDDDMKDDMDNMNGMN